VGRFARAAAVGFEGAGLPRAVVTGVPLRPEIARLSRPGPAERRAARRRLGIAEDRRVVSAVGGSLGARRLNQAVLGVARRWAQRGDLALYHVVGKRDFPWASAERPAPSRLCYRQVEFERDMADFYAAADVVVCRAGAVTVAELAAVGVASVLVPLPGAPGDHQRANAEVLAGRGAAVVVEDAELDEERLAGELDALLGDPERLAAMADKAASAGRPDALAAVTSLVEEHARRRRGEPRPC
jgi:UDP-N-acetylglucosamine--N-acetylmuramyl-(pentapeptide) pyrophosphoryl-undecaprenol N-acetylglucosamine transferase